MTDFNFGILLGLAPSPSPAASLPLLLPPPLPLPRSLPACAEELSTLEDEGRRRQDEVEAQIERLQSRRHEEAAKVRLARLEMLSDSVPGSHPGAPTPSCPSVRCAFGLPGRGACLPCPGASYPPRPPAPSLKVRLARLEALSDRAPDPHILAHQPSAPRRRPSLDVPPPCHAHTTGPGGARA